MEPRRSMSLRGYSLRLYKANQEADSALVGVQLGRYCMSKDIPVIQIAGKFNVSRMTIYQWFTGAAKPSKARAEKIKALLEKACFSA
jgi:transcriptional regulator with XRE-family HTH domain